ncbi:hypothetical protein ACFVAF_12770 [Streptomyces sp. NPDC057596]|uniref:hypothetical protein n=1 Tax=Streptomyces sp. NPDC057596 TaxID=3346178 RepID=UPI0036911761
MLQPTHETAVKAMRGSLAVQEPLPFRPLQHVHVGQIDPGFFQLMTGSRIPFFVIQNGSYTFHGVQVEALFVHPWLTHMNPFVSLLVEGDVPKPACFTVFAGAQ